MKKIFGIVAFVIATMVSVNAQKLGHANSQEILMALPEAKEVEKKVADKTQELQNTLLELNEQYQAKVAEYEKIEADPSSSQTIKQAKYQEIISLQQTIQQFQMNAEQELGAYQQQVLEPVRTKILDAITKYGTDNGYTYIIDNVTGVLLLANGDDLTQKIIETLSANKE